MGAEVVTRVTGVIAIPSFRLKVLIIKRRLLVKEELFHQVSTNFFFDYFLTRRLPGDTRHAVSFFRPSSCRRHWILWTLDLVPPFIFSYTLCDQVIVKITRLYSESKVCACLFYRYKGYFGKFSDREQFEDGLRIFSLD